MAIFWVKCLTIGLGGGLLSGMLGVGGGIIMVPLLMLMMGQGIHDAKANSLGIIVLVSIAGTIKHQMIGRLDRADWGIILACGVSAMIAGPLGVMLSEKIDRVSLGRLFGLLLVFSGLKYLMPEAKTPDLPDVQVIVTETDDGLK